MLAYARYRTVSLWLPIGLHIGWAFGVKMFKAATWQVVGVPEGVCPLVQCQCQCGLTDHAAVIDACRLK